MRGLAMILWISYALTGLPLTLIGFSFTGGGVPQFALLDDYSDPLIVLIWLFGAITIFILPIAAIVVTVLAIKERE